VDYYRALREVLALAWGLLEADLLAPLPLFLPDLRDTRADGLGEVNALLDRLRRDFSSRFDLRALDTTLRRLGGRVSAFQREQLVRQLRAALAVDPFLSDAGLEARLSAWVAENVAQVKSIPARLFDEVEKTIIAGARAGQRHEDLAKDVSARFNVAMNRARVVARDQVLSFYSDLNRMRQTEAGVTHYVWRSANDSRVRAQHQRREGKRFAWKNAPAGGHPGEEPLCRCYAEPDLSALLGSHEGSPLRSRHAP
jgi:SPP1 gp7 family putative phage head morphogenesis protein